MTIKVYVDPTYTRADRGDGGIRRVSEAEHRYLPQFGVQPVASPDEADIIANHGASLTERPGVPTVSHCHGLYWQRYQWDAWAHSVNAKVVESMAHAVAVTAPSEWVAAAIRRGMCLWPEVIYHGIDADDWPPPKAPGNYVLWNKARTDPVSDPRDMNEVAKLMPRTTFVSTFGAMTANVEIVGAMTLGEMRKRIRSAGVYLATARETFGIGTLEALASGVPVAGWAYGGQAEIVRQGETGYLAPYGDYPALADAIARCFAERGRLSEAARADAIARWSWPQRIAQYAALYERVVREWRAPRPRVSVIVTCHDLARFLPDCLDSILGQTVGDWECVIVDDASSDNTPAVAVDYAARDTRIHYERTPENLKLPGALNFGIQRSGGRYVLPLDADNMLDPRALEVLAAALDTDHGIHIAYGHLDICDEDGRGKRRNEGWPPQMFDWRAQMGHMNHITSTALVRREVYERLGGYRLRMWRAEDAEFWCRATSFGFRAKKVTELSIFTYRNRSDSKSKSENGDGNWVAWFPWGYAATAVDGARLYKNGKGPRLDLVPWGAQGRPPEAMRFWEVPDHTEPLVSVIIPVGPGHRRYLLDALDSLISQTFQEWEAIVVYDDGDKPARIAGAPWARMFETKQAQSGPGVARNVGAKNARGKLLYFLDADDFLLPQTLEKMVAAWKGTVRDDYLGDIIYGGWLRSDGDGKGLSIYGAEAFECGGVLRQMQHSVNVLLPRAYHELVGGFDENMAGWEDWDYFIAMQATVHACSTRLDEPLFVYAFRSGTRRESSFGDGVALKKYLRAKWERYYKREDKLVCYCNQKKVAQQSAKVTALIQATRGALQTVPVAGQMAEAIKLRYGGPYAGPVMIKGPASGAQYKFGHEQSHREKWVRREDVPELLARSTKGIPWFTLAGVPEEPPPLTPAAPAVDVTQQPVTQSDPMHEARPTMELDPEPAAPEVAVAEPAPPAPAPLAPAPADDARPAVELPKSILGLPVKEARALIADADADTLLAWLRAERMAEKPRSAIVAAINRALSKVPPAGAPESAPPEPAA